jgi:hypothetical protein
MRCSVALMLAVAGLVIAAPQVSSAADMPAMVAPRAAPQFSWTGFYVGGHFGAGWDEQVHTRIIGSRAFPPVGGLSSTLHILGPPEFFCRLQRLREARCPLWAVPNLSTSRRSREAVKNREIRAVSLQRLTKTLSCTVKNVQSRAQGI